MRAFVTKIVVALLGAGLMAAAGTALACNTGCHPPAPPSPPHNPPPPNMPCHSCSHGGGNTNVNVNVNVKASASASASGGASAGATYYGGYGNWSQSQGIPQEAGNLNVLTGAEGGGFETYEEERRMTSMMILQATCIDDTGVPHPASQLNGDRDVDNGYVGEIFRCIAGTHMQVVMVACGGPIDAGYQGGMHEESSYSRSESESSYSQGMGDDGYSHHESHSAGGSSQGGAFGGMGGGAANASCAGMDFTHVDFGNGRTMSCQKGEALWFEGGNLTCRQQIPQRQCNERSLLRRFGAGIKVLTVTRVEKVAMRREVARSASASYGSAIMTFDGGVGGFVQ